MVIMVTHLHLTHKIIGKFLSRRFFSIKSKVEENSVKKYTSSINLPKTKFPSRLNPTQRIKVEESIRVKHLAPLYKWQQENLHPPDFVLHDGPPYANGDLHAGHLINKILKDIILKHKILCGKRVHYRPGWDCHGLPIELKALNNHKNVSAVEIREKARNFATEAIQRQKESFELWGVVGNWRDDTQIYRTFEKGFIKNQLQMFFQMYQKGLIFKDMKPVFWSPSSRTALAEAELEYDENFTSPSLYFKCEIFESEKIFNEKVFALVWTTTPWTLPANQAICYNPALTYKLVKINGICFIVCSDTIQNLINELEADIEILREVESNQLERLNYRHPVNKQELLPFFEGSHVKADKGTGLVHTAPSHGPEDFLVFLNKKLPLKNLVDGQGCYNSSSPNFLRGKYVLKEGNEEVLKHITPDIVKLKSFIHSYPIDWRTKKPVIILASEQWFIETEKIKSKAIKELENVQIFPEKSSQISKNVLKTQLEKRPYWCISRQRSWGVPIPVLYCSKTKTPLVNQELINFWIKLVEESGSIDFWWEKDVKQLIPDKLKSKYENVTKGMDILDIWFDSGISWSYALDGDQIADLYLEGVDQFTGWFQSSLMTSVGIRQKAPYKNIFVHGFAVDENGKKMSKSLGNVINPETIVKKYGVDVLRWWVAAHSTQHSSVPVSFKLLDDGFSNLVKVRSTLKYLLGVIETCNEVDVNESELSHLDKFILHKLTEFNDSVENCYKNFQFNRIVAIVNNFVNTDLSSCYLHLIKDRLYCGTKKENQKLQKILLNCYRGLCKSLWPITPFLVEESWGYLNDQSFYKKNINELPAWNFPESVKVMNSVMDIKRKLNSTLNDLNSWKLNVTIEGSQNDISILKTLHPIINGKVSDSELCDIFQVSSVILHVSQDSEQKFSYKASDDKLCPRCRRYTVISEAICRRCEKVLVEKGFSVK